MSFFFVCRFNASNTCLSYDFINVHETV